jgi:hypothetical protein
LHRTTLHTCKSKLQLTTACTPFCNHSTQYRMAYVLVLLGCPDEGRARICAPSLLPPSLTHLMATTVVYSLPSSGSPAAPNGCTMCVTPGSSAAPHRQQRQR